MLTLFLSGKKVPLSVSEAIFYPLIRDSPRLRNPGAGYSPANLDKTSWVKPRRNRNTTEKIHLGLYESIVYPMLERHPGENPRTELGGPAGRTRREGQSQDGEQRNNEPLGTFFRAKTKMLNTHKK